MAPLTTPGTVVYTPPPATDPTTRLDHLARFVNEQYFIVSCYLSLEPGDRTRQQYLSAYKSHVHQLHGTIGSVALSHEAREAIREDVARIEEFLARPTNLPSTPGLAIFASGPLQLWEVFPLPYVTRDRVVVAHTPNVREAVTVVDRFGRILLAAVDRAHGRLFEVSAFESLELPCITSPSTEGGRFHSDREDAPGWGERSYHNRIHEEKNRHYGAVAECMVTYARQHCISGVVLADPGPVPEELKHFLDKSLAARLLGTTPLNPTALSSAQAYEAATAVRAAHEAVAETARVSELQERFGEGWATLNVRSTLRALYRGQVRELIVPANGPVPGFRCSASGELVLSAADCDAAGPPVAVPDILDDAIEEAYRQRVHVTVIHDSAVAAPIDGMAALLRFR